MDARIDRKAAGKADFLLEVLINGREAGELLNKGPLFKFENPPNAAKEQRWYPYRGPTGAWNCFISPDFETHNQPASPTFVFTSPGHAYRYEWRLPAAGPTGEVTVSLRNVCFLNRQLIRRPLVIRL